MHCAGVSSDMTLAQFRTEDAADLSTCNMCKCEKGHVIQVFKLKSDKHLSILLFLRKGIT